MSQESEIVKAHELAKKVVSGGHLTPEEKRLLDASETLMAAYLEEVFPGSATHKKYGQMNGHRRQLTEAEREKALQALRHGQAVLAREFPGVFPRTSKSIETSP